MECGVCGMRSSVGYCVVCQKMLCEECGIRCEKCSKIVCSDHMHETSSGKQLCIECQKERKKEYARRRREADVLPKATDEALPEEEEELTDQVLTTSAQRRIEPWAWSLFIGIAGAVLVLLLLLVPSLRRAPVTTTFHIPTSIAPIVVALFAVTWAIIGWVREEHYEDRPKCLAGLGVAVVTILLAIVAIWTDPARDLETETQMLQTDREGMSEEELEDWRNNRLERFDR